jgi:hypothetical protein
MPSRSHHSEYHEEKKLIDWCYFYLLPTISIAGLVLELISVLVFFNILKQNRTVRNFKTDPDGGVGCLSPLKQKSCSFKSRMVNGNNKLRIYKYLLIYSLSDAVTLLLLSFVGLTRCGFYCDHLDRTIYAKAYELYIYLYAGNTFATFSLFIELIISVDRFVSIVVKKDIVSKTKSELLSGGSGSGGGDSANRKGVVARKLSASPYAIMLVALLLSAALSLPYLFMYKINVYVRTLDQHNRLLLAKSAIAVSSNRTLSVYEAIGMRSSFLNESHYYKYKIELPEFYSKNIYGNLMFTLIHFAKDAFFLVFIFTLNVLLALRLRHLYLDAPKAHEAARHQQNSMTVSVDSNGESGSPRTDLVRGGAPAYEKLKKFHLQPNGRIKSINVYDIERRVTHMILFLCFIFLVGHIPEMFYKLKSGISSFVNINYLPMFLLASNFMAYSTRGLNFFVYYFFNIIFKETFKDLFFSRFVSTRSS